MHGRQQKLQRERALLFGFGRCCGYRSRKRQGHAMSVTAQLEERPEGGHVARLTIDNAAKLNSLNSTLMSEIIQTADGLAADPQLRLVVLTGARKRRLVGRADSLRLCAAGRHLKHRI